LLYLSDKQRNFWLDPVFFFPLTLAFIWIVLYLPAAAAAADDKKEQGALRPAPNDFLFPILSFFLPATDKEGMKILKNGLKSAPLSQSSEKMARRIECSQQQSMWSLL